MAAVKFDAGETLPGSSARAEPESAHLPGPAQSQGIPKTSGNMRHPRTDSSAVKQITATGELPEPKDFAKPDRDSGAM